MTSRVTVGTALCIGALLVSSAHAIDLVGRWRLEVDSSVAELVDITQDSSTLTIPVPAVPPDIPPITYSGTPASNFSLPATVFSLFLRGFTPDEETLLANSFDSSSGYKWYTVFGSRCECDDGNTIDGDGCDATCRVERCYACTPPPASMCMPLGDGATCEDGNACTTGETCTAGACGGGTPFSPCVDLTGTWDVVLKSDFGSFSTSWTLAQNDATLVVRNAGGAAEFLGSIDAPSGALSVFAPSDDVFCVSDDDVHATADPNGNEFSGTMTIWGPSTPFGCAFATDFTVAAARAGTHACGDGVLSIVEGCDDGNTTAGDCCDAACQPEPAGSPCSASCSGCDGQGTCALGPLPAPSACRAPGKSVLSMLNRAEDGRDSLVWEWRRGEDTPPTAFGDPTATVGYEMCIFDAAAASPTLLFSAAVPAAAMCASGPCWTGLGAPSGSLGYRFKAAAADTPVADGVRKLQLRPGIDGRAQVSVRGKGEALLMPGEGTHDALPATSPVSVRVELRADNGECWAASYSGAETIINDADRFKARGN